MQIGYQDFTPATLEEKLLSAKYEELPAVVARANDWIKDQDVQVINVETVQMLEGTDSDTMVFDYEMNASYHFVRVWYQV